MATTYKVLGQSAPAATTPDDMYTVPASKAGIGSSIVVCNRGAENATYRVSISVGGGATADTDYIVYDADILANDTIAFVMGVTLATTDVVRVYASTANLTFSLFGSEIDV